MIAEKHGVTVSVVKNIKFLYGKKETKKEVFSPHKEQMQAMLDQGMTDQEIYNKMHDFMTDAQFRETLQELKNQ